MSELGLSDMELRVLLAVIILGGLWAIIALWRAFWNAWGGKDL